MIKHDLQWMNVAIQLAKKGLYTTQPNPRVGCVIVKNNQLISQGWHKKAGGNHAEINALENAQQSTEGAEAFITLEPCCHHGKTPPCVDALIKAKIVRVVVAMLDPNSKVAGKSVKKLEALGIKVEVGLLEAEAKKLNLGFIKRFERNLPRVVIKSAMSLDGRTAMASGESQWITGKFARQDVQKLRTESGAIITGITTILKDDPSLTVRNFKIGRQPLRVILDSKLQISLNAKVFQTKGKVVIFSSQFDEYKKSLLQKIGVQIVQTDPSHAKIDLTQVLTWLSEHEVNQVLVEAGAKLSGSFLKQHLADELVVYLAPKLLGSTAKPLFDLPLDLMSKSLNLKLQDIRHLDTDLKLVWRLA